MKMKISATGPMAISKDKFLKKIAKMVAPTIINTGFFNILSESSFLKLKCDSSDSISYIFNVSVIK
jgi:arginine utilization protein RocB